MARSFAVCSKEWKVCNRAFAFYFAKQILYYFVMIGYNHPVTRKSNCICFAKGGKLMPTIDEIRKTVTVISKEYGVENVYLFGSYARGDNNEDSDIDLRIDKGAIRGLFMLSGFRNKLIDSLGKEVDVLTTQSLDKNFLDHIAREEILLYANRTCVPSQQ